MKIRWFKWFNKKTIILFVILLSLAIFFIWKYEAWRYISIDYIKNFTKGLKQLGSIGVVLYIIAFVLATLMFLPSLPFVILGGITYGTLKGIIYASIGDLGGAIIAFIMARYIMRQRVEKKLKRNKRFHEINKGVRQEGWRILILTRMVPIIPHCLQNYAYGLTSISFKTYSLTSLLCIVPPIAVWVIAINKVGSRGYDPQKTIIYIGVAAVAFIIISYIPKLIFKRSDLLKKTK
ncbi:TVP38/TMEM64 family protein [Alkaliphilus transvaalensis]|uniref:TVP38/TMEM64 family protein n=1 Tax=Alkaliphilus transvaalensis TaxID=114628 RepID=UPI00047CBE93|nr:TVP38/TMEM64 family protein [Alkaliphilus transvaalensis]